MQIQSIQDVGSLAAFIARLQSDPSHHIGHVSENPDDIASSLQEIDGLEEQFFVAEDDTGIRGFVGVDLDFDRAWIYGPMCDAKNWDEIVNQLWKKLEPSVSRLKWLFLFADTQNTRFANFAERINCLEHGHECVLEFSRTQLEIPRGYAGISRVATENDFAAFVSLHDQVFPGTYYDGKEILERLNDQRALFVLGESELLGYSYAEVSEGGEASLEFIGVVEHARGKGVGKDLMDHTLEWIFSFAEVEKVSLTVSAQNIAALAMYAKSGFLEKRHMISYRKHPK
jgi:ribosomal protein S18 acetylase RimI-like enzyme